MRTRSLPTLFGSSLRRIHAVGVGGMGLGPLAIYLADCGFSVTGEDDGVAAPMADALRTAGIRLTDRGVVPEDAELVVHSSAVASAHPALDAARARGLKLVRRGELLAEVTAGRRLVAVCGSHGKTTTTAMLVSALRAAKFPAGYILGGLFADAAIAPARVGSNDWVVAEIDESDGTIDRFAPEVTVALNLDWDHPDRYRTAAEIEEAFVALFQRTRGPVLVSDACVTSGCVIARRFGTPAQGQGGRFTTFGRTGEFRGEVATDAGDRLTLNLGGRFAIPHARVQASGDFNANNAVAALAAAQLMGAELAHAVLADFPGVRRRQAVLHRDDVLTVMEDYAHHPAEIRALLGSLRRAVPAGGRLVVVFQPHRFSRTKQFKGEFAAALAAGDRVHLIDVYGAGEAPIPGGTTADLYAELQRQASILPVAYFPGDTDRVLADLLDEVRAGDFVVFIGAGDIDRRAREWLQHHKAKREQARAWDAVAEELVKRLSAQSRVRREEPLARKTTLRVGGAARVYVEPATVADLQAVVRLARERRLLLRMLGRGSNLLIPDSGVDGIVVSLRLPSWEAFEPLPDGRIRVSAGLRLKNLCGLATRHGYGGFEFLEGIPGNVGGALRMNAGAMGGWMFDVVDEVDVVLPDGEFRRFRRDEMNVDYRHCAELEEAIAVAAILRPGAPRVAEDISRQIDTYRDKRQKSQPREPSAGCIFKNPPGDSAGRLIDACGLKGERIGDAEVSGVHGNFIINRGQATSADVLALVRRVRTRVEQQTGIRLQPEVLLFGGNWEEEL